MACQFLPLLLLNFLVRRTLGQEGLVLDFAPVPFGELPTDERKTDQIPLKFINQDGFDDPQDNVTCAESKGPFGNQGTLDVKEDVSEPWKVRIVNVKDYYIWMNSPPSSVEIYLKFGPEASKEGCDTFRPPIALTSPREKYGDLNDPLVVLGCEYMSIEYTLSVNTACNLFGKINETDIEFTINSDAKKFLRKGNYTFQPCASYMEMLGVETVQFIPHAAGRFLEGEATCPYCPPDDPECPCCYSKDDDDIEQKLEEVMEQLQELQEGTSEQKPSSVAIAAVSLGAIATALGLVNLGILLSRRQT